MHFNTPKASGLHDSLSLQSTSTEQSGNEGCSHLDITGFHTNSGRHEQTGAPFFSSKQISSGPHATRVHALTQEDIPSDIMEHTLLVELQSLSVLHSPLGATLSSLQPWYKSPGFPKYPSVQMHDDR